LTGMRFLSLHGYTDAQLARLQRMLSSPAISSALSCGSAATGPAPWWPPSGRKRKEE
jgi:hypothetical protein